MSISQCIISEFPDILSQILVKNCIVGMLLICPTEYDEPKLDFSLPGVTDLCELDI